ncbi:hypothetical protein C8R48DRAFT_780534 [Suillus tomentosus]|nr:hypothetical protein C8R48DRAFT_780534 [Suillus tomentosus]
MTSSNTDHAASIGGASGSSTDSLAALFSQLNVSDDSTVALASTLREIVQNAVIAALQEVAAASTGAPAATPANPAATPANPAATPAKPAATPANTIVTLDNTAATATTLLTRTHHGVTYYVPHPSASGPFYWVNRGRQIGVFATWQGTSTHVIGVSRSSFSKIHSVTEGIRLVIEAIDRGETEIIP